MTELGGIFAELGISQYLNAFLEQGFDTWETILDITESDFDALDVKLGHRRKLQRKIANARGLASDAALASPRNTPSDDRHGEEPRVGYSKPESKEGSGPHGAKRKYRRHPKPDENAPERPPSAYVIFSNKMREELKGRNLSFTEIAKLVGENWQNLSPKEKEPHEQQAFTAKERYNIELAAYKATESYIEYSQYLTEFKARQANQAQAQAAEISDAVKRPKLKATTSTSSSGTASSTTSSGETPSARPQQESHIVSLRTSHGKHSPQASLSKTDTDPGAFDIQTSEIPTPTTIYPGYRESILGANTTTYQPLVWKNGQREDHTAALARLGVKSERSPTYAAASTEASTESGPPQRSRRQDHYHVPPPFLTSESSNQSWSTGSTESTTSAAFFGPRTPKDLPLERSLPIPLHPFSKSGYFEGALPPLRPPSMSPQMTVLVAQQSPNGVRSVDYSPTIPSIRDHPLLRGSVNIEQTDRTIDENILDPVSALIRAGEIVNRNSRRQNPPS